VGNHFQLAELAVDAFLLLKNAAITTDVIAELGQAHFQRRDRVGPAERFQRRRREGRLVAGSASFEGASGGINDRPAGTAARADRDDDQECRQSFKHAMSPPGLPDWN